MFSGIVGWIDQNALLLGKRATNDYHQRQKVQDFFVYDLKSQKEESIGLRDVTYLAFE